LVVRAALADWLYASNVCKPFAAAFSLTWTAEGCRQSSPVLFAALDNGWLGKPVTPRYGCGVVVPGVPSDKEVTAVGLLLADDLEGDGNRLKGVHNLAQVVSSWCNDWEMVVGISKCGVMCVGYGGGLKEKAGKLHQQLKKSPPA